METRIFVVNLDLLNEHQNARGYMHLTDEEFMSLSEEQGSTYSVAGFQEAFNNNFISTENCVIRVIEVDSEQTELRNKLQDIYNDIVMLKEGTWEPDYMSCMASIGSIEKICEILNIKIDINEQENNNTRP